MKSLLRIFSKKTKCSQKCEKIDGIEFKFKKNPLSKTLRISLKSNNCVLVTFPRYCSFARARDFALTNLEQIKQSLKNIEPQDEEYIETLRKKAKAYLPQRLEYIAQKYSYTYNRVFIKRLKTRWGSCSFKNNINLNLSLMTLEEELIDYVLLHELVHTVEKNHANAFWARLLSHMPDARQRQKVLKSRKVI